MGRILLRIVQAACAFIAAIPYVAFVAIVCGGLFYNAKHISSLVFGTMTLPAIWVGFGLVYFFIFVNADDLPNSIARVSRRLGLKSVASCGAVVAILLMVLGILYGLVAIGPPPGPTCTWN